MTHNFRELKVWSRSVDFVVEVYSLTKTFPKDELYGLISQLRRAATSIALNIAEGTGASSNIEFARFLEMARRSAYEVMTGLEIAQRLNYFKPEDAKQMDKEANEIAAMISGLIKRIGK